MKKNISLFSLLMLISGSIDSIRNLPVTALFGANLIFFFFVGALIFLIPTALVSAQLAVISPEKGGIYNWSKQAFGARTACFAVWLQWINTMVWFPSILMFIAATLAYLINPHLAQQRGYLIITLLCIYWGMTWLNMRGIKQSTHFASACAVIGLLIPFALILVLGGIWIYSGHRLQINLAPHNWIPHLSHSSSWISLTGVVTSFLGMELATVHVGQIQRASTLFPRALSLSVILILAIMIFGALSIAIVIPANHISLVAGVMQSFQQFFRAYHMNWLLPIIGICILIGSLGGMINWLISPAKGLLHAAEDGFLPAGLAQHNQHGVASRVLILQAVVVSLICLAMLLMPSVNGAYWLLTDLSTELYLMMYVIMFIVALVICHKQSAKLLRISGGKWGLRAVCLLGLIGCVICIIIGFIPPQNIAVGGAHHFELLFISGLACMLLPVLLLLGYRQRFRGN